MSLQNIIIGIQDQLKSGQFTSHKKTDWTHNFVHVYFLRAVSFYMLFILWEL